MVLVLLHIFAQRTHAQAAFQVTPHILEIAEGQDTATITVTNTGNNSLSLEVTEVVLRVDSSGIITPLNTYPKSSFTIASHASTLAPETSTAISLYNMPSKLPDGQVRGVKITSVATAETVEKTISRLSSAIVIPILPITSQTRRNIRIDSFHTPVFNIHSNAVFDARLSSSSMSVIKTTPYITIKNALGQVIKTIPLSSVYLTPKNSRTLVTEANTEPSWNPAVLIGIYRAELHVPTDNGDIVTSIPIIGIPVKFIIILAGGLVLASGIYLRVRKYR